MYRVEPGESIYPEDENMAYEELSEMLRCAHRDARSVVLTSMGANGPVLDLRFAFMNLKNCSHEAMLTALAFAVVRLNDLAGTDIRDDLRRLGKCIGLMIDQ